MLKKYVILCIFENKLKFNVILHSLQLVHYVYCVLCDTLCMYMLYMFKNDT